ncbi:MAG: VCBS repeat-containing protein [Kiritimatiellae bacterium]|nr:VCBS repeat-containing protein [Kiritimatiellia bacterium]
MDASKVIVEGTLERVDAKERIAVAALGNVHKGDCVFKQIKMNIALGQQWFPEALMKHMKSGAPVLFFYDDTDGKLACLGHTSGIWFQLFGELKDEPGKVWWRFTHIEIYMNRTYVGDTPALTRTVADALAGKATPPAPKPELAALTPEVLLGRSLPAPEHREADAGKPMQVAWPPRFKPELIDGFEAYDAWHVEGWGNPAQVTVPSIEDRGKVLYIRCAAGEHDKVAVTRELKEDLSKVTRVLLEARHDGQGPVGVALALWTMHEDQTEFYESRPLKLAPGRWKYDLEVDLTAGDWKCAATDWEYRSKLLHREAVARLSVLVYGADSNTTVEVDRIRGESREMFVRAINLEHGGREARGVTWVDYDGDGALDVLLCSTKGNRLYRNEPHAFVDVTAKVGLAGGSRCAGWADYDADGDLDLFVGSLGERAGLWTQEKGAFRDTSALLPRLPGYNTEGAGWLDANGDGGPDILLSSGEHGVYLFLNRRSGPDWFKDVSKEWGLGQGGIGTGNGDFLSLTDFDGDGFCEFLYNLDSGVLTRNEDGKTFRAAAQAGVRYATGNETKLGAAFGDFDTDGNVDLFVPQYGRSKLYRNNNDFTFADVLGAAGALAKVPANARTAVWGDFNADGRPDLVVGFADAQLRLYTGNGDGTFSDATEQSGFLNFRASWCATGLSVADWDEDGDLDLLVTGERTCSAILVNGLKPVPGPRAPLRVRLPRTAVPGTVVRVTDGGDRTVGVWHTGLARNFSSQGPPEALFAVEPGEYRVAVLRTNGELTSEKTAVGQGGVILRVPATDGNR